MVQIQHRRMKFKVPSGTSRGILKEKDSWFLQINKGLKSGIGECSIIDGLSIESAEQISDCLLYTSPSPRDRG